MKKILFITLVLICSSCSKKGAGTPATLRLLSSAITAGLTTSGGALITGNLLQLRGKMKTEMDHLQVKIDALSHQQQLKAKKLSLI